MAETVTVHMLFAIMFFQYAVRNHENAAQQAHLNAQSNLHHHFSLGKFYELMCSHTVQDVQALTLICAHLRNFPKPGASWILTTTTLNVALELGLHRSARRWSPDQASNPLDVELRKRIFYTVLTIHITLSGKLGRPMHVRAEDFDVELPDPVDDELLSENGIDTSRPGSCLHRIGIEAYRIAPLYMELYSTIYAVRRRPEIYMDTVTRLESRLRAWQEGLPSQLVNGESGQNEQEGRVFALYAQLWALEFRLLLRHPSVSMTQNAAFNAESMVICVDAARQMLTIVKQLQTYKSLDTTWYNSAVYVMAITTTLFFEWERRDSLTTTTLASLRQEMDQWLNVMGEVGALLGKSAILAILPILVLTPSGSGNRLRDAVGNVTDGTLGLLSRCLQNKNAASLAESNIAQSSASKRSRTQSGESNNGAGGGSFSAPAYGSGFAQESNNVNHPISTTQSYVSPDTPLGHHQTPYPAATQYSNYPEPSSSNSAIAYTTQEAGNGYGTNNLYHASSADSVEAPLLAAFAAQASQAQVQPSPQQSWARPVPQSTSQAWQQWTSTMTGHLEPQDCYSASALMQLGGRDLNQTHSEPPAVNPAVQEMPGVASMGQESNGLNVASGLGNNMNGGVGVAWPLNVFDIGQQGSGS